MWTHSLCGKGQKSAQLTIPEKSDSLETKYLHDRLEEKRESNIYVKWKCCIYNKRFFFGEEL